MVFYAGEQKNKDCDFGLFSFFGGGKGITEVNERREQVGTTTLLDQ